MLKTENLSKCFGETQAVSDLSLEIEKGEIVGLLGPNGAGKTTTMQMLSGLLQPDSGLVTIEDSSVRDSVSVVFQEVEYSSKLKVREFLHMMAVLNENTSEVDEVVDSVNLRDYLDTFVPDLSGGNKKKLNIAAGMLKDPEYLLLDEPNAGLDPRARKDVRDMIQKFKNDRGVLVSTHSMEEAEKLCDRVVIIEDGEEIVSGSPEELIRNIDAEFIIKAEGDVPSGFESENSEQNDFFEIHTDKPHEVIKQLVESGEMEDLDNLSVEKPGLEDVFFEVTGRRYEKSN
ncbi:ABC transporter ATP-binding protein [Candidatus Nanohalobium constans]|uniref:ABC-2 type transport system ATP-binding protein n=1 Tax=Candidatus Nanohalobium constans TaxID=2565781 RepID=A0A5Q0UI28_9ARCH|nr:ABC transporter ATP-binding protein [Candidatus Nanohalobium constans]QGA80991.1 ABC-2 type transport system ATP-binding protein [Candidatus Nanohalobium constans]